jgi:hypothetical protein
MAMFALYTITLILFVDFGQLFGHVPYLLTGFKHRKRGAMSENRAAPFTESKKSQKETALISDTKPFCGWWIVAAGTAVLFVSSGIDQFPDGEPSQASSSDQPASVLIYSAQMRRWTRSETIRTVPFWFTRYPSSVIKYF